MKHPYVYRLTKVLRVVDGDTYDLELDLGFHQYGTYRFRLLGIDTPELRPRRGTDEEREAEKAAARDAAAYAETWLMGSLACGPVWVSTFKGDSFGRWLAHIRDFEGDSMGDALIAAGHAVPYRD